MMLMMLMLMTMVTMMAMMVTMMAMMMTMKPSRLCRLVSMHVGLQADDTSARSSEAATQWIKARELDEQVEAQPQRKSVRNA
eukprot:5389295-Pleurochrysis_carterae.AAC.1